jgi:hypothetical protein
MLSPPGVVADLIDLKASIDLALPDLTVDPVSLARQLNRDSIPVTAWLTLPTEQGYYLNASNGWQAEMHFDDFEKWTTAKGLRWAAIGLDIEPNIEDFATLRQASKWHLFWTLLRRDVEALGI